MTFVVVATLLFFADATVTEHGKSCGEGILDASIEIFSNAVHEAYTQANSRSRFVAAVAKLETLNTHCDNARASWLSIQIMKYTMAISVQHDEIGNLVARV